MAMLKGRRVVLGVTGSIAAYKSAFLVRELVKAGAQVRVVMTPGAREFITPLTLGTLSGHPVHSELTDDRDAGTWTDHVELGLWGDVVLVAPATAHTLAGMVEGRGDSLLVGIREALRGVVRLDDGGTIPPFYPYPSRLAGR